ncbi:MAG: hypothetical protein JW904_11185 [Spirochaetales bacterium]|nr:hypothetical protein [Spirochaetales bacterium]
MTRIINFEDDIFFLAYSVKKLADGLLLELDPSIFLDKIVEEISFVSRSVDFFINQLKSTSLKVNRVNYLKSIHKLNAQFTDVINGIVSEKFPFSIHMKQHKGNIEPLLTRHREYETEISDALSGEMKDGSHDKEIISEEEYKILFAPDENEEQS